MTRVEGGMKRYTNIRYHVQYEARKEVHRARMVAIEDKYGTKSWRCVECEYRRPAKDEDE